MILMVDDPDFVRVTGRKARLNMQARFCCNAIGMNYRSRLEKISSKFS